MSVFFQKLYVRIWLAVVLAVAVLTLLVGWAWRVTAEPPLRNVVVRNEAGDVIGSGQVHLGRPPEGVRMMDGHRHPQVPPPDSGRAGMPPDHDAQIAHDETHELAQRGKYGYGPEFTVQMNDGQTMHLHLPRPPASTWRAPLGFFWTLGLVAVAVALAIYPIVRRLTRRLESLQRNVERWGDGDLSVRMTTGGNDEVSFLAERFNNGSRAN